MNSRQRDGQEHVIGVQGLDGKGMAVLRVGSGNGKERVESADLTRQRKLPWLGD